MIGGRYLRERERERERELGRNSAGASNSRGLAPRPIRRGRRTRPSAYGPSWIGWEAIHTLGREAGCETSSCGPAKGGAADDRRSAHGPSARPAGTGGEPEARAFLRRHGSGLRPLSRRVAGGGTRSRTHNCRVAGSESRQDGRSEIPSHAPEAGIGCRHRDLSGRAFGSAADLRRTQRAGRGATPCRRAARSPTLLSEATFRPILRHSGSDRPRPAFRDVASRGQVSCVQPFYGREFYGKGFSVRAPRRPGVRSLGVRSPVLGSPFLRGLIRGLVPRGLSARILAAPPAPRKRTPRGMASGRVAARGAAFRLLLPPGPDRHDIASCGDGLLTASPARLARRWRVGCAPRVAVPVGGGPAEPLPLRGLLTARVIARVRACLPARAPVRLSARAESGGNPAAASGRLRAAKERAPSGAEAAPEGVRAPWATA